ncbi:hypothetical protein RchiOBHm_Chr1g0344721 [Rosa chinensis]|uniref:SDE2/SF3A3 SAP domain-containing protein n=1 Tax=Rosa chinensis TaxID=74649 RepID=A0A2P6SEK6_ROSCH|nr:hypothetical protein RchiOBHm_Chr1g0344721 [Rosa chinensis]
MYHSLSMRYKRVVDLHNMLGGENHHHLRQHHLRSSISEEMELKPGLSALVTSGAFGIKRLKLELQHCRLKCGGTQQERAARLFMLKFTHVEKIPKKLLAKK